MFCYQCEQTAGCAGCSGSAGVCGKTADIAGLQDELTGALIGLARAANGNEPTKRTDRVMTEGLFATLTNVNFDEKALKGLIARAHEEKEQMVPECGKCASVCGRNGDYDMKDLWQEEEDIRSLKSLILFGLKGMAAYAYHAMVLGYEDETVSRFFYKGLSAVGQEKTMEELLPLVMETGEVNLKCMELLDKANTDTFGVPAPASVSLSVEAGPFIVVSGHDLYDLKQLLEATEGKGINIYTHGELLPAHAYPELRKYGHLKGNFGTAWQNQQKEFADIPAPVLFTTNCLMPVRASYSDRVFTTGVVSYPGMIHIGEGEAENGKKDFTPLIKKTLELGGYKETKKFTGINGGSEVTTGFGHGAILSAADKVVEAVKSGTIRHFFLVGGCDGARAGRNYYTEFVKKAPEDSVILTLACGKFRFNDLNLGTIGGEKDGLPRLMDMGQCNDAYGAVRVAAALAEAFECGLNDLPLTLVLSWYEQKAVCILLTLLYLGMKKIYLGPTLPAFLSKNVLNYLVENYDIRPISTPEEDLKQILQ
ncbi:hydroxylamine reductase [Qiania dongpingensis]|uniref:Hydroxylamine reductase n=1 Tax=Qiania dongpingensis TaxID=2763669 RepID=A0A7G9G891_9FIRM|nr:hydroxylamine reductase [Qiania dongpingensis]QNM07023.1 hydroxylamine reductase [Qiania dongpingensis]